jgi:hypothetical protein
MKKKNKDDDNICHIKFAQHYSIYGNATRAYLNAYPETPYGSARTLGSKFLTNLNIQILIEQHKEEFKEKYFFDKERMIKEIYDTMNEARSVYQYNNVLKAQEMIIKLLDIAPKTSLDLTSMGQKINIQLNLGDE